MSASPTLSVVIPTHKRAELLRECLAHLQSQTIADQIEVIVVSDGEDKEAEKVVKATSKKLLATSFLWVPKSHQGVARNEGVKHVRADRILFIGDDIFLESDACEKHVHAHKKLRATSYELRALSNSPKSAAVLGFTTWDPSLAITPVMKWLERTGWQFGYPKIARYAHGFIPKDIQERFTYTSHISVPTEIAKQHPFREDVTLYGWEDILWGKELRAAGVGLYYEPDAKAFHHHPMTLDDSLKRMETLGKSLVTISKIDPNLGRKPEGVKLLAYRLISLLPTMRGRHYRVFLRGMDKR